MNAIEPLWLLVTALVLTVLAGAVGWLLANVRAQRRIGELGSQVHGLETSLEHERRSHADQLKAMEQAREQLSGTFSELSTRALRHNSEEFLRLAQENLKQYQAHASGELGERQKAIEHMVRPIRETLEKTERQLREIEKERRQSQGELRGYLESLTRTQEQLQGETRNLVQALRRPEVRGQWGEMTLRRVVELAGMVEHCDFYEQQQVSSDDGTLRPDMVVRMPERREIVVDVKTPLDAYLTAMEAPDEASRRQALKHHSRKVRERVRELSAKSYWGQFKDAPDFVVLFIPGEQFLAAALELDRDLLEDALRQKIILATPTSFVALLRAVAYGWRQQVLAENAERVRQLGEDLYGRLATFTAHLGRVGKALSSGVDNYNRAVGSLERQVLPGARKMKELGVRSKKELETPEPLEVQPRRIQDDASQDS